MQLHADRLAPPVRRSGRGGTTDVGAATAPADGSAPRFCDEHLANLLQRAAHAVTESFHSQLRPRGVPVPVWRVLSQLAEEDGVGITDLARVCLFKQPTLTKVIDRMERQGLVERRAAAEDRRKVLVFITAKGRSDVAELVQRAHANERNILSGYSDDEVAALKTALRVLIQRSSERGPRRRPAT
ncbi:MAG: MarR family transcriptional regulator [Alphaproteobacteria bacterium]|nr:MarR family transcriptional regulator [Alphaproteobacteria bacterium]